MRTKLFSAIAALALFAISGAEAATYMYQSDPFADGSYITATVDLNCAQPPCTPVAFYTASDVTNQNTNVQLSAFTSTGSLLFSVSPPSADSAGFGLEISLLADGTVNSWFLYLKDFSSVIYSIGYTGIGPDLTSVYGVQAGWVYGNQDQQASGLGGSWTETSNTPLPAALPLFATGLGALGLFGWRRKRKQGA